MIGRYLTFVCLPQVQTVSSVYDIQCINKQNGKLLFYEPEIPRPPLGGWAFNVVQKFECVEHP